MCTMINIHCIFINQVPINNSWIFLLEISWFLFMVLNATFNNISIISWRSVLLVDETGIHRSVASHWQTFITYYCIENTSPWTGFELTTLVVLGIDCKGSCKSNYRVITTTTTPIRNRQNALVCKILQQIINIYISSTDNINCMCYIIEHLH